MKFNTFLFRDLDNNYVLARRHPETKEIALDVIDNGFVPAHELPLNQVEVVTVTENQEDVLDIKHVTRFEAVTETDNNPTEIATLFENDQDAFWKLIDRIYDLVQLRCSMQTQSA